jgi:hypothetical protein
VTTEDSAILNDRGFVTLHRHLCQKTINELIASIQLDSPSDDKCASVGLKRGVAFARRNLLSAPFLQSFLATDEVCSLQAPSAPDSVPVRAILFDKTGDANWTVPWHQDRSIAVRERIDVPSFGPWSTKSGVVHVQPPLKILRQMVTLRFSLDSCPADNGPLRAISGTHQAVLDPEELKAAVHDRPQTICTTNAGGVVIMRPLIVHASSPAKRVGHRRVLHIEFGPPNLPGGLQWAGA